MSAGGFNKNNIYLYQPAVHGSSLFFGIAATQVRTAVRDGFVTGL